MTESQSFNVTAATERLNTSKKIIQRIEDKDERDTIIMIVSVSILGILIFISFVMYLVYAKGQSFVDACYTSGMLGLKLALPSLFVSIIKVIIHKINSKHFDYII